MTTVHCGGDFQCCLWQIGAQFRWSFFLNADLNLAICLQVSYYYGGDLMLSVLLKVVYISIKTGPSARRSVINRSGKKTTDHAGKLF